TSAGGPSGRPTRPTRWSAASRAHHHCALLSRVMSTIAFALAAFAAGAAALLWRFDARQRPRPEREQAVEREPEAEVELQPQPPPQPPEEQPASAPERRHGLTLPLALRRERRA